MLIRCSVLLFTILLPYLVWTDKCRCSTPCSVDGVCSCTNLVGSQNDIGCISCKGRQIREIESEGIVISYNSSSNATEGGYMNHDSCSVVLKSPKDTGIRLYITFLETECGWDFLHIKDGTSPFASSLARYGGLMVDSTYDLLKSDGKLISKENTLYIVFRPDDHVNHDGFQIYYRVDTCPGLCGENGYCVGNLTVCQCDEGWTGASCGDVVCECGEHGACVSGSCQCESGYSGTRCRIPVGKNWWSRESYPGSPGGRANFGGALVGKNYWVFGGYQFDRTSPITKFAKFDLESGKWSPGTKSGPSTREGHTLTAYKNLLIMFGGQVNYHITDDLWKYDTETSQWHQLNPTTARISSMGHCAVLVNTTIYFLGGIASTGVIILDIQTYELEKEEWTVLGHRSMTAAFYDSDSKDHEFSDGRIYHGRFAPSCVHNPITDKITVFGGLNTTQIVGGKSEYWLQSEEETIRESTFVEYDFYLNHWGNLYKADMNTIPMTFLAGAVQQGRNLFIFGGRHFKVNETRCYSALPYVLNLETGEGRVLSSFASQSLGTGPVRMGLQSFPYNSSVYYLGGYNGVLHDDFIVYHIVSCESHKKQDACLEPREDFTECQWDGAFCSTAPLSDCGQLKCGDVCIPGDGFDRRCVACQSTSPRCTWDQNYPDTCRASALVDAHDFSDRYPCREVPSLNPDRISCSEYKLCEHCTGECVWSHDKDINAFRCFVNINHSKPETDCSILEKPCNTFSECSKCLEPDRQQCMWCALDKLRDDGSREGQCLDTTTYPALFPFGQCLKWSMSNSQFAVCPVKACVEHGNCTLCQAQPECGWCDDGSGTGTGACHPGTYIHPLDSLVCPTIRWNYDKCPLCQCNGHSNCTDNIHCDLCTGHTIGLNCDTCLDGYHGDATNNGVCEPCDCGHNSEPFCVQSSGRCRCNTRGVAGLKCDTCLKGYEGDPSVGPHGTCFDELKPSDPSKTIFDAKRKVNFLMHLHDELSNDITLILNSDNSEHVFKLNVTITYADDAAAFTFRHGPTYSWKDTYKRSRYDWNKKVATLKMFLEFVHHKKDQTHRLRIDIKESSNHIDLKQFFIIFFSCIVILLLIFLLAWTAKIRYSQYRLQRNQEIQLMERALRPFKPHKVLFKDSFTPTPGRIFEVRPLAIEPLSEEKYAIVDYLLTLPGPNDINLAVASGSFVTALSYGKIISNPNIHFAT